MDDGLYTPYPGMLMMLLDGAKSNSRFMVFSSSLGG